MLPQRKVMEEYMTPEDRDLGIIQSAFQDWRGTRNTGQSDGRLTLLRKRLASISGLMSCFSESIDHLVYFL